MSSEDLHVCLTCQATIVGLDNYVHHKKVECPAKKPALDKDKAELQGHAHSATTHTASIASHPVTAQSHSQPSQQEDHFLQFSQHSGLQDGHDGGIGNTDHFSYSSQHVIAPTSSPSGGLSPLSQSLSGYASQHASSHYSRHNHGIMSPSQNVMSPSQTGLPIQSQAGSLPHITSQSTGLNALASPSRGMTSLQSHSHSAQQSDIHQGQHDIHQGQHDIHQGQHDIQVEVSEVASLVASTLSPTTNRSIDPNMVLYGTGSSNRDSNDFMNFFSSLELQSKWNFDPPKAQTPDKSGEAGKGTDLDEDRLDHQKALRIASILNELAFSSDSEDFRVPSDAEDLLNSVNDVEEGEDRSADHVRNQNVGSRNHPPRLHTGGKWRPGSYPPPGHTRGKWKPSSKLQAMREARDGGSPPKTGGKWRPGQRTGGKRVPGEEKEDSNSEENDEEEDEDADYEVEEDADVEDTDEEYSPEKDQKTKDNEKPSASPGKENTENEEMEITVEQRKFHCSTCNRTLNSQGSYDRHCTSAYHQRKASPGQSDVFQVKLSSTVKEEEPIECSICQKTFNYKYNFARHLASSYHLRRAQMCDKPMLLDESCQILLLRQSRFQCHICSFYCSKPEYMVQHMRLSQHIQRTTRLVGPILCVRCRFACRSNADMVSHVCSKDHFEVMQTATRPCIIKESRSKIKCPECDMILHSATMLKAHLKGKHGDNDKGVSRPKMKPFCPYCHKRWNSLFSMAIHIRRRHTKEKPFKCEWCKKAFADKYTLALHKKTKTHLDTLAMVSVKGNNNKSAAPKKKGKSRRANFKCDHCPFTTLDYADLRPHYLEAHASKLHHCDICGFNFVQQKSLETHLKSRNHMQRVKNLKNGEGSFPCGTCGRQFAKAKKRDLHELAHKHILSEAKALSTEPYFGIDAKFHEFVDSMKKLLPLSKVTCVACNATMTKQNILPHLRAHSNSTPFKCMYCSKSFNSPLSLRRHLMYHLDIRDHECKECGKKYMKPKQLRMHMLSVHSPNAEKKFPCDVCSESFTSADHLKQHQNVHKPKVHKCPFCRYAARLKADMTAHMRSHTHERPFLCDECGWSAKTKKSLLAHRRTHTGERNFHCEYCAYKATTKHHLHRHMRIHIGTKPYKCPYCAYSCNTLDNLQKHIVRTSKHKGLPIYPCKSCDFGTNNSKEFRDHAFYEHGIEDKDIGLVCSYMGIYNQTSDVKKLPEGSCALPVKERLVKDPSTNTGKKTQKKAKRSAPKIKTDTPLAEEEPAIEIAPVEYTVVTNDYVKSEDQTHEVQYIMARTNEDHSYVCHAPHMVRNEANTIEISPETQVIVTENGLIPQSEVPVEGHQITVQDGHHITVQDCEIQKAVNHLVVYTTEDIL